MARTFGRESRKPEGEQGRAKAKRRRTTYDVRRTSTRTYECILSARLFSQKRQGEA